MGYDLTGKNGNYFRANIWSWPMLLNLIRESEVLPDEVCEQMAFNDGAGPETAEEAHRLARKLEALLDEGLVIRQSAKNNPAIEAAEGIMQALMETPDITEVQSGGRPTGQDAIQFVKDFIEFCHESGGFNVC